MPKHLATPRTSGPQTKNTRIEGVPENVPSVTFESSTNFVETEPAPEVVDSNSVPLPEPVSQPVSVKEEKKRLARKPKKQRRPRVPKQRTPKPPRKVSAPKPTASPSGSFDFQAFMSNLAPVDIVAILGFAFLAGWTLWFSIECFMMPVIFPAIVSLIACIVFLVCFVLLIRARIAGPYVPEQKVDALYEAPCSIRVIDGIADDKDSDVKACTVLCTRENLILNFKAWQNIVAWNDVEIVGSPGARGLTVRIPRDKTHIVVVRMTFSSTDDRFAVEQICKKYSQRGKDDVENANV